MAYTVTVYRLKNNNTVSWALIIRIYIQHISTDDCVLKVDNKKVTNVDRLELKLPDCDWTNVKWDSFKEEDKQYLYVKSRFTEGDVQFRMTCQNDEVKYSNPIPFDNQPPEEWPQ